MKAQIGDRVIVASARAGTPARAGTIVELRHEDGSPPYVVHWDGTDSEGVYFPGSDGHIESSTAPSSEPPPAPVTHVTAWVVDLELVEAGDETTARAVLRVDDGRPVQSMHGRAIKAPHDASMPLVGDKIAAARALRHLAEILLAEASSELSDAEHRDVILTH